MRTIALLALAAMAALSGSAEAAFHLWKMTEAFSNADGTVQFIEFHSPADGEGQLFNHELTVTGAGGTLKFTFADNLPFRTRNKNMLLATEGFAAAAGIAPDFVIPNGFLPQAGGQLDFAGVDKWDYGALPVNGTDSLTRLGVVGPATPRNFAGQFGSLSPAQNFQALWWASPANSESGWGLNITHQGDILFATWFTYDRDGSAMWLVAPAARRVSANAFQGLLYRTTGPAFDSTSFNPAAVAATEVGSATFTFSGANDGTFAYVAFGVAQTKAITRQLFGPATVCAAGLQAGTATNFQDLWWRGESESGWGVNIAHQGDILFATWFTYDSAGKGMWVVMPEGRRGGTGAYSGKLYRTTGAPFDASPWDPARVRVSEVGEATFTFSGADQGTFAYVLNGVSQSKPITRQVFSTPRTVCQ